MNQKNGQTGGLGGSECLLVCVDVDTHGDRYPTHIGTATMSQFGQRSSTRLADLEEGLARKAYQLPRPTSSKFARRF